jgi:hypothetical protein
VDGGSPEWRNWQTRWTQKRTFAAFSDLLTDIQEDSRLILQAGPESPRIALLCSFLLIVWL